MQTKKVLTIFPVEFIYVWRAGKANFAREEETRTSMSMNRTHSNSIAARGRRASGQTYAGLFSEATGFAAVSRPGSLPTYLPGGELMCKDANSTINLWNSDRRVSQI
jgi:hypothetical protein